MVPVTLGVVFGAALIGWFFLGAWIGAQLGHPLVGLITAFAILIVVVRAVSLIRL
jgi:hypothetical protein